MRAAPVIARLVVAFTVSGAATACAQSPADLAAIKQELAALRQSQEAMAKEVEAIRTLLQQAMGPRPAGASGPEAGVATAPLKIAGRPARGSSTAPVTLVEYSDYECPFCAQYVAQTYAQIEREYVRTNKVRYIFKNFPIEQMHPRAFQAHVAAACAGDQRRYWEMHDKLFADQANLHLDRFVEHAVALALDSAAFRACMQSGKHDALIREDIDEAVKGGVRGTPVFVLAVTDPAGQAIVPARVIVGAQPFDAFRQALDALLAQPTTTPKK